MHSGSNITLEESGITRRLANEALSEVSLPGWPFLIDCLQLIREDILTNAYNIYRFGPLQSFYLGVSKLSKK